MKKNTHKEEFICRDDLQITNETGIQSIVFLGGNMISITTTVGELLKEVSTWGIKYWSSAIYDNELRLFNYENYKEKGKILNSDVVIVVKLPSGKEEVVGDFSNRLLEFIGKSTGMRVVK